MVDVLTLNYNDADTVIAFVKSIENYKIINQIVIVDNCSTDDSYQRLQEIVSEKVVVVQTTHNGGYGAGNNYGIRYLIGHSPSKYVLQCNPDVIIREDVIKSLEVFLSQHSEYIIAAPFMLDREQNKVSYTAFPLATKWQYILSLDIVLGKMLTLNIYKNLVECQLDYKDVDAVAGSLFMYDLEKMSKAGMYDEHIFLYCEEMTLGLKLKAAGYKTALLPKQTFIHNHSVSISKTFKSAYSRRMLLVKSKLYVIREKYHANSFEYAIAWGLSHLSFLELMILGLRRKRFFKK